MVLIVSCLMQIGHYIHMEFDSMFKNILEEETEFIPLITSEDEGDERKNKVPKELPILPLRNTVLFPGVVIPITVGRDKSIALINEAYKKTKIIGVVSQKDDKIEEPGFEDINQIGTMAQILKVLKMPDGNTTVIIQGKKRIKLNELVSEVPYLKAKVEAVPDIKSAKKDKEFLALVDSLKDMSLQIIKFSPNIPSDAAFAIKNIEAPSFLINFIASNMNLGVKEKQLMLEIDDLKERATHVLEFLTKELQMTELKNQIQTKVKVDLDQQQKEYFLNQQLKTIQEELGGSSQEQEIHEFLEKAETKNWSKEVKERFDKEIEKLRRINPQSAEYSVHVNYIDFLLELPWKETSKDKLDLKRAKKILDRDHHGLEDVKERILEYLAVIKLKGDLKAPILCLYGPPGVGKTSLGKSIAEAIGRKYVRMSLGGMRDEAEIRGHRKTYIGAMPGRILQNIKKVQTSNPVFVLDELDKISNDFHGDPSSALLEVLDPEQNNSFYDNYLEMDYDLSKVMFVATANSLGTIQSALRDRLEIIEVSGYTTEEKIEIAKKHLIPKQIEDHGLNKKQVTFSKKAIQKIIESYTRESGVRSLEKKIAKLVRNTAKFVAEDEKFTRSIDEKVVQEILGPGISKESYQGNDIAGVVTGLAWTQAGGEILFIEASVSKGKGKLTLTGNLGDVMKESAALALEYLRAHASQYGLSAEIFDNYNLHIHVPEGATPKDGPSAGITMLTAIASSLTQRKVKSHVAMTGEITLRGRVLPVGGIKEKILAGKRANIKEIILSKDNEKDVLDIDQSYMKGLKFHYVSLMDEVLEIALLKTKVKNTLDIK